MYETKNALKFYNELIQELSKHTEVDYSPCKDIILEHFETQLLNGNWDSEIYFETLPRLRFMQEDEYDQHMGDNPPEYDFFLASWYIAIEKD